MPFSFMINSKSGPLNAICYNEETKQPLAMTVAHMTTLTFYHFVEKSVKNDLQVFTDFFFFFSTECSTPGQELITT